MLALTNIQSGEQMIQIDITTKLQQWVAELEFLQTDMEKILQ